MKRTVLIFCAFLASTLRFATAREEKSEKLSVPICVSLTQCFEFNIQGALKRFDESSLNDPEEYMDLIHSNAKFALAASFFGGKLNSLFYFIQN